MAVATLPIYAQAVQFELGDRVAVPGGEHGTIIYDVASAGPRYKVAAGLREPMHKASHVLMETGEIRTYLASALTPAPTDVRRSGSLE